jgi:hypothetical protein
MIGRRFGKLVVASELPRYRQPNGNPQRMFKVDCDCGREAIVRGGKLRAGETKSCGCDGGNKPRHGEATVGQWGTREYRIWRGMLARCNNTKSKDYPDYGGRGIAVCQRWAQGAGDLTGFECFLLDMGRRPSPQHSIDRYPNKNGNYEPGNVRWATATQQNSNRRTVTEVSAKLTAALVVLRSALDWIDKATDGREGADYLNGDGDKHKGDGLADLGKLRRQIIKALEN